MQALYLAVFVLHVAASALGLVAMFPPLFAQKGGRLHARAGWLFSFGMLISGVTGAVLAVAWVAAPEQFRPSETPEVARVHGVFLALIGTITGSAVIQAHRALERKRAPGPQVNLRHLASPSMLIAMAIVALVVGGRAGHVLSLVFGVLALALATRDIVFARRPLPHKGAHLYHHIQSMGTACIAAVTAFFVLGGRRLVDVESFGGPAWLMWGLPGVVLGTVFGYWTRHYRRKFANRAPHAAPPSTAQGEAAR
jgi:hypothetical protein